VAVTETAHGARARQHARYEYRAVVSARPDVAVLCEALAEKLRAAPTARLSPSGPQGLALHAEPAWFLMIGAGALAGTGILGHVMALHAPSVRLTVHAHTVAAVLDALAVVAVAALLTTLLARFELRAEGGAVVLRRHVGRWLLATRRVEALELTAALVVGTPGALALALVAARNEERLVVVRERWTDPPGLMRWMADAAALIAGLAAAQAIPPASARACPTPG
jgi:hypothetical protein